MNIICVGVFSIMTLKNLMAYESFQVLILAYLMVLYFVVDVVWLLKWPECNPSPYATIFHHILSSTFIVLGPISNPIFGPIMIKISLTEPTTWLAHFRRFIRPRRYYLLDVISYVSIFVVRHLWSPYLAYELILRAHESLYMAITAAGVVFLNCMYVFWTVRYTSRSCKADLLLGQKQK